ncbi:hypothetical protein SESBI_44634 [Sesbania bispinosa]|nr:hypothetical protein SESBI_44634 [Sesbania bispinosa]
MNASAVEGPICEAYLVEETSTFASYYYPLDVPCRRTRVPRNDDGGESSSILAPLSIFNNLGRPSGKFTSYILGEREMKASHLYVLLNCPEVEPYLTSVYGFKCDWFYPTPNQGTRIDNYGIVEIKASRRYKHYDPFIFVQQAKQVYYSQYPEGQNDWLVVIKTKARSTIETLETNMHEKDVSYQDESMTQIPVTIANDNLEESLVDIGGKVEEIYAPSLDEFDFEEDEDVEIVEEEEEEEEDEEEENDDNEEIYSD